MLNGFSAATSAPPLCDVALVLNDYHVITAPTIHDALALLLEYLPPHLHLVILTRADPALPLAHLRARGSVTELHASDLRFTPDEAAAFLNQAMGLSLTAADLAPAPAYGATLYLRDRAQAGQGTRGLTRSERASLGRSAKPVAWRCDVE